MSRTIGRPRSAAADEAIITSTLELLAERGISGISIEAIAADAGVGKTTIYRRWENKDALIVDALATLHDPLPELGSGSVRDHLVELVESVRKSSERTISGKLLLCMAADASDELMSAYKRQVIEPRRELMRTVLRSGIKTGELKADLDIELALALLIGPMLTMTRIWKCSPVPQTSAAIVDGVLGGLAADKRLF